MSSTSSAINAAPQAFHFCRVTRIDDRFLGHRVIRRHESLRLAEDNVGVFAGGYRSLDVMDRQLTRLARSEATKRWVVAVSTKNMLSETLVRLRAQHYNLAIQSCCGGGFRAGFLRFTTVEALSRSAPSDLEGLILFDPACHVHRARTYTRFDGTNHDRPQLLADFLANRTLAGGAPLFCLMTVRPPRSIGTARLAEVYMLDGWLFADPYSLSFVDE